MLLPSLYDSADVHLEAALNALPDATDELIGTQEARTRADLETALRGCRVTIATRKENLTSQGVRA